MKHTLFVFATAAILSHASTASARLAPFFKADAIDGQAISLESQLRPRKILLLSFWASWCVPCLEELKNVSQLLKDDKEIAMNVLSVNVDTSETRSDVKPTIKLFDFKFPVVLDPKHEIFSNYRADKSLPFSVVIDSDGKIIETFNGYSEAMVPRLKEIAAKVASRPNAV